MLFAVLLIKEGLGFQYLQSVTFHKNEQNKLGTKDIERSSLHNAFYAVSVVVDKRVTCRVNALCTYPGLLLSPFDLLYPLIR